MARRKRNRGSGSLSHVIEALEPRRLLSFPVHGTGPTTDYQSAPMAVDEDTGSSFYGDIYVATAVNVTGGGTAFAVTRFSSSGTIDTTWGTSGTKTLPSFVADNHDDRPRGIAVSDDGTMVAVVGTDGSTWEAAVLNTGSGGSVAWQNASFQTGQANAVTWDDDESGDADNGYVPDILVAGTDGTDMIVWELYAQSHTSPNFTHGNGDTQFGTYGDENGPTGKTVIHTTGDSSTANAIITLAGGDIVVGGSTEYSVTVSGCCGGETEVSDFTIAYLDDVDGYPDTGFGNHSLQGTERINFSTINNGGSCTPSSDAVYGLAEWHENDSQADQDVVYAVGTTNLGGTEQMAIARFHLESGSGQTGVNGSSYAASWTAGSLDALQTDPNGVIDYYGFGAEIAYNSGLGEYLPASNGTEVGADGAAYGVVLPDGLDSSTGNIAVTGATSSNFYTEAFNGDTVSGSGSEPTLPAGSTDTLFGSGGTGYISEHFSTDTDAAGWIAVETNGDVLVGGTDQTSGASDYTIALDEYAWNG